MFRRKLKAYATSQLAGLSTPRHHNEERFMKRIIFILCGLISVDAYANELYFKPYAGADYDEYNVSYTSGNGGVFSNNLNGGDIHVGARLHKYIGVEASYFDTAHSNKSNVLGLGINTSAKVDGWALDAMGYLPLENPKFELIGTAGIARTSAKGTASAISSIALSDNETKPRIGIGAQYWITNNLNVRGLMRYQDADFKGTADNIIVSTLGLNWQF